MNFSSSHDQIISPDNKSFLISEHQFKQSFFINTSSLDRWRSDFFSWHNIMVVPSPGKKSSVTFLDVSSSFIWLWPLHWQHWLSGGNTPLIRHYIQGQFRTINPPFYRFWRWEVIRQSWRTCGTPQSSMRNCRCEISTTTSCPTSCMPGPYHMTTITRQIYISSFARGFHPIKMM